MASPTGQSLFFLLRLLPPRELFPALYTLPEQATLSSVSPLGFFQPTPSLALCRPVAPPSARQANVEKPTLTSHRRLPLLPHRPHHPGLPLDCPVSLGPPKPPALTPLVPRALWSDSFQRSPHHTGLGLSCPPPDPSTWHRAELNTIERKVWRLWRARGVSLGRTQRGIFF